MTPDQLREKVLVAYQQTHKQCGQPTLWIAISEGHLQEGQIEPERFLHVTPKISREEFQKHYLDLMIGQHQAHIFAITHERYHENIKILTIDIVSVNRHHIWDITMNSDTKEIKMSKSGLLSENDLLRLQDILRKNTLISQV